MKTPLGVEVDLGPGHIVLDRDPAPPPAKGAQLLPPLFGPCLLWPRSPISATAALLFDNISPMYLRDTSDYLRYRRIKRTVAVIVNLLITPENVTSLPCEMHKSLI